MAGFGGAVKLTGESEYRKALRQITQELKELSAETKLVSAQYSDNSKSLEALTAKQAALGKQYEAQTSKVNILKSQYASMTAEQEKSIKKHEELVETFKTESDKLEKIGQDLGTTSGEYKLQAGYVNSLASEVNKSSKAIEQNENQMSKMRTELTNASTDMVKTEKDLNSLDKEIKTTTDDSKGLGKWIKSAGDDADKAAKGGFTVLKGIMANLGSAAIQSAIRGIQKLGSELVNVGKEAYSAYAQFEQLTGGVETIFKESANIVKEYAATAYKTAGMSANTYMQTVTSFSTALLRSLNNDTQKAAEYSNKAILDMSDNANKMGSSLESIQAVYSSLARGIYTTLDNLKLGFSGTKTGAQELIKEAERLDSTFKAQRDSSGKLTLAYADMVDAIHIVQSEMGITGTTAKEAEDTIEGSTKAMQAAWQNLLVSIASDNGDIKKSVKQLTDSIEVYAKNAVPRIKKIVEGVFTSGKKLAKKYMPDIYKTVAPPLEKLGKVVKDIATFITKNFKPIASIVLTAAAAFTTFNAVMAISTTVMKVTSALSALTAGVGMATKATTVFNAVLSSNPIMAVVTAILALVAAYSLLSSKTNEAEIAYQEEKEALEEQREEIYANLEAWNDLQKERQKSIDIGMTEVSHLEDLKKELKQITDENGHVKKGYEERAAFIVGQLNKALGTEITLEDNVIENLTGELNAIDELIKKKKAQIMLESQEEAYNEALNKRAEAIDLLNELEDDYNKKLDATEEISKNIAYWQEQADKFKLEGNTQAWDEANRNLQSYQNNLVTANAELESAKQLYEAQDLLVQTYTQNIVEYGANVEAFEQGHYDQMTEILWNYSDEVLKADDVERATLEAKIRREETNLKALKTLREKTGSDIYDQEIANSEKELKALQRKLDAYTAYTEKATNDSEVIWDQSLGDELSALTGHAVEFKMVAGGLVQAYIDGQATGPKMSKDKAAEVVTAAINELQAGEPQAETAGKDIIRGVNSGISNQNVQSGAFSAINNFGNKLLGKLRASLKEASPSKASREMGVFLDKGVTLGIKDGATSTLKTVADFGKSIISTFDDELKDGTNIGEFAGDINDELKNINPQMDLGGVKLSGSNVTGGESSFAGYYQSMVSAFKDALGQMTVELDDKQVGKFVTKTVTNAIYNT